MSTSRLTFGAILSTVQTTANTVTNVLDAGNAAVGMLNAYVTQAADNQRIRQIADKETFIEDLIREKAMQQATQTLKINKFTSQSTEQSEAYEAAYATYQKLLRTEKSE